MMGVCIVGVCSEDRFEREMREKEMGRPGMDWRSSRNGERSVRLDTPGGWRLANSRIGEACSQAEQC